MSSSDKTSESRGTGTSPLDVVGQRPLPRLLLVLFLLLAVLVGAYTANELRSRWFRSAGQTPLAATLERDFPGAAFADEATIEDIRLEAEQAVDELIDRYPQLVESHYARAYLNLFLGQAAEAAKSWRRCLELDPMSTDVYLQLASLELDEGRPADAVRLLRQAMACPTKDPRVPGILADALFKQHQIEEAAALLERQIRKRQASGAAVTLLGQCYLQRKEYERAKTMFQTAVATMPQSAKAQYGLAQACQRLGEKDLAQEHMSRFQELARADRDARILDGKSYDDILNVREIACETLVDIGRVYLGQGEFQDAEQSLLKASVFDEQDQDCWELLVLLYEQTQQPAKGLLACQKLCQLNPQNSAYWLNAGLLYGRLLRREEALHALEKALSLSPDDPECRRVYEIIRNG